MQFLDVWDRDKIIHKDKIKCWEFLDSNSLITEITDEYYFLNTPFHKVEQLFYEKQLAELKEETGIVNIEVEYKRYMDALHRYNDLKDVLQAMLGRIADRRGVSVRNICEELNLEIDD